MMNPLFCGNVSNSPPRSVGKRTLSRRKFIQSVAVTAGCLAGAPFVRAAAKSGRKRRPNLIFVMADQWRRQAMGYTGEDPVKTPVFDQFAKDSLVFNQSCATRPICSPSRACLLTGLYAQHHGLYNNGLEAPLDPTIPMFGSMFQAAGYRTSFVGKLHTGGEREERGVIPELHRNGWDHWAHAPGHRIFAQPHYLGHNTTPTIHPGWAPDFQTEQTIGFMRENRDHPFAAVLSWGPPHPSNGKGVEDRWLPDHHRKDGKPAYGLGYIAPPSYEAMYQPFEKLPRRPNIKPVRSEGSEDPTDYTQPGYFGACTALDTSFGRVLESLRELDLYDDTLIVFTSDHGEMLGSQGRMQKGIFYEESIGVPLLMRLGSQLPARRVDDLCSTIDLAPTMMGLLGVKPTAAMDGKDFSMFVRGERKTTQPEVFLSFDTDGLAATPDGTPGGRRAWRTIRTERYSYTLVDRRLGHAAEIKDQRVLYDLASDPYQMKPIFGSKDQPVIGDLHGRLAAHLDQLGDKFITTKFVPASRPSGR